MSNSSIPGGVWLVRGGIKDEMVDAFQKKGAIALDWPDVGDLALMPSLEEFKTRVFQKFSGRSPDYVRDELKYLLWFMRLIDIGDYVLMDDKRIDKVLIGKVTGNLEYNNKIFGESYPYIRHVNWLKPVLRDSFTTEAQQDLYSILPIEDIRPHRFEVHKHITGKDYSETFGPYQDIGVLRALVRELAGETDDFLQSIWDISSGGNR